MTRRPSATQLHALRFIEETVATSARIESLTCGFIPARYVRQSLSESYFMAAPAASWIKVTPAGLEVTPGGFTIDPVRSVDRAVITHGHGDHARPGHGAVLATAPTLAIMETRFGPQSRTQAIDYGTPLIVGDVRLWLEPAGHVLGSAQVVMEYGGTRVIVSGDYKRRRDPTTTPFVVTPCDVFVTEATFALPVFCHPDDSGEIEKLLESLRLFPDRTHLVGAYALGKAQRIIMLLREAGHSAPIFLHGALIALCDLYRRFGIDLGRLTPAAGQPPAALKGQIVLCPPGALADRWSRRMDEPVLAMASGWMRIRQRAKQRGIELPLVISDHADWGELMQTIEDIRPGEVWVTHGREEALIHALEAKGVPAKALSLVGYEDENDDDVKAPEDASAVEAS
jgi:putative mRNA 3-end processing factor